MKGIGSAIMIERHVISIVHLKLVGHHRSVRLVILGDIEVASIF